MSGHVSTKKKILIALALLALIGACFAGVGLYMHYEVNKEKFILKNNELASKTELPAGQSEAYAYVKGLYDAAVSSEAVECSWHTDVKLKDYDAPLSTPLSAADNDVILYIWEHAEDDDKAQFKSLYPSGDKKLNGAKEGAYQIDVTEAQLIGFTAKQGREDENGNHVDDDYYFITLNVDPSVIDAAAIPNSETYKKLTEKLSPALSVQKADIKVNSVSMTFKIARYYDEIASLEITRSYAVAADVTFTDAYAALLSDGGKTAHIELPYQSTEKVSFKYYGAHFTQAFDARKVDDMRALPVRVNVNDGASRENGDYTLTFKAFNGKTDVTGDIVSFDEDGVMTVKKACADPLTVEMTLEYNGEKYVDTMTLYVTELEVATENG